MYYVGYEALVDSEQTDYAHLLPETPLTPEEQQALRGKSGASDIMNDERPSNLLTVLQPELEICTNTVRCVFIFPCVFNWLPFVGGSRTTLTY